MRYSPPIAIQTPGDLPGLAPFGIEFRTLNRNNPSALSDSALSEIIIHHFPLEKSTLMDLKSQTQKPPMKCLINRL